MATDPPGAISRNPGVQPAQTRIDLDSDPQTPGVQISKRALEDFARAPSIDAESFLRRITPESHQALAAAFEHRRETLVARKGATPTDRLTFQDREKMAAWATGNARRPPGERVKQVRVGAAIDKSGTRTSLNVAMANGARSSAALNLPSGFSAAVQPDNSIVLSRTDGGLMHHPHPVPNSPPSLDHILLYPHRGADGSLMFQYQAGHVSNAISPDDLNAFLSRQPPRPL